jgi:hypothetical protein
MRPAAPLLVATLIALTAGCGGGGKSAATSPTTRSTTTSGKSSAAQLKNAVRRALQEDDRLSGYVLWSNRVPASATRSTRGPALAALRRSAADRRTRGIRIRTLSDRLEVTSIEIDPSYTKAIVVVRSIQRVQPYKGTKPSGPAVKLDERAKVEVRRLGTSNHFVVWRVRVLG